MIRNRWLILSAATGYCGCIVAANYLVGRYGIVPVGFGLSAPAGVFMVSPVLVLRDWVQWYAGRTVMLLLLAFGLAVSYAIAAPAIATASALAFGLSELTDYALFTWVAPRWARAVFIGGIAGAIADSAVFLWVAFGSLDFMSGQILGKAYGIVLASMLVAMRRRRVVNAS